MAPHFMLVYRGTCTANGSAAAAKRQQPGGAATGKKKTKQANAKKRRGEAAASGVVVVGTSAVVPKTTGTRKRKTGRKAPRVPVAVAVTPSPAGGSQAQEQQQTSRPLQTLQSNAVPRRPLLRKPVPLRKLGAKATAKSSPSSETMTPLSTHDRFSFSSSASTLVAGSSSSTPCLNPASSPARPSQTALLPPSISQLAAWQPASNSSLHIPSPGAAGRVKNRSGGNEASPTPNRHVAPSPILKRFSSVLTSIDGETFTGGEDDLIFWHHEEPGTDLRTRGGFLHPNTVAELTPGAVAAPKQPKKTSFFAKVNLYANARLPPNLPQFKVQLPLYPMICLAAQYSQSVYQRPTSLERETHVDADWRMGTKAMVLKSIPVDNMNVIVFAIRGTHTFMDWAVNLHSTPTSPQHFLEDPGNLCHSGFLSVARRMIRPVAARLHSLLEEDPARSACSLVLTGHSAGGAVASLLYAHMVAQNVSSELRVLAQYFKRIHCFTFGAPPVSLLPLRKPDSRNLQTSAFLSFINEGDPVPRADKDYVYSLVDLFASPSPSPSSEAALLPPSRFKFFRRKKTRTDNLPYLPIDVWQPPPGTLANAGRLVVLRKGPSGAEDDIRACSTTDQQLRTVMFGDPMMHMMKVYEERLKILAVKAVTGGVN